ncbi:hypothetical protein Acsp06_03410 [Actinomycetospora sp. NBRC 106375]|uniref:hypothetical protein n=1 Tax=Actinomycetospora sp. NBRC 106375 TaxID=3032207 RepID=UPI0024A435A1|nr:hypothetical protein [Actinomycetospora sp. NBRC 106375]GLZ44156.1 hypothetical protein Acsp06_03410 [Actinomycetospora sp. NBRC 106375]
MKDAEKGANKAFDATNAPEPGPGREPSSEERDGMTDTETAPQPPLGVGESINARAEDIARENEEKAGEKGASGRPYGHGSGNEPRGVHPNPPVTEGSPDLPTGDQGG